MSTSSPVSDGTESSSSSSSTRTITKLIFFDMDGTLVSTGCNQVHEDSFSYAIQKRFEGRLPPNISISEVTPMGKTDCWILSELLTLYGIPPDETDAAMPELQKYMIEYCLEHRQEIQQRLRTIDGIKTLLTNLKNEGDTILGLVTGNLMRIAMMKVVAVGLEGFFTCGGFGSDAKDRAELIRIGIERALKNNPSVTKEQLTIYHVGDTRYDLDAALRANVRGIGVATGNFSVDTLKETPGDHFAIVPSLSMDLFAPDYGKKTDTIMTNGAESI